MPYRRLPNTDNARLRALKRALRKGEEVTPMELPFTQSTFQKVKYFLPIFEQVVLLQRQAVSNQTQKSKEYYQVLKKARLYISHFIQVLNFAIIRGEIPAPEKKYYSLNEDDKKVPSLNTENDIIKWGERIIKGEAERTAKGGNYVTNPTIAVVKVRYEKYLEAYKYQKSLKDTNNKSLSKMGDLRSEADEIILNIWNEVEDSYKDEYSDIRREKAREYGLVFVYRKSERSENSEERSGKDIKHLVNVEDPDEMKEELQYSFFF